MNSVQGSVLLGDEAPGAWSFTTSLLYLEDVVLGTDTTLLA